MPTAGIRRIRVAVLGAGGAVAANAAELALSSRSAALDAEQRRAARDQQQHGKHQPHGHIVSEPLAAEIFGPAGVPTPSRKQVNCWRVSAWSNAT